MRGSTLDVRIWRLQTSDSAVYRRQILASQVDPPAVRVKSWNLLTQLSASNDEHYLYDFKLKKPFSLYGLYKNMSAL